MKNLIIALSLIAVLVVSVYSRETGTPTDLPGLDKGFAANGKFFVGITTVCAMAEANPDNVMDWLIRPNAKVWYSYSANVSTYGVVCSTGGWTGESCSLDTGETFSSGGRIGELLYFKTDLVSGCTLQIDYFSRKKYK